MIKHLRQSIISLLLFAGVLWAFYGLTTENTLEGAAWFIYAGWLVGYWKENF